MGLSTQQLRFLLFAKASGVRFTRTLTIGRQQLFMSAGTLERVLASGGVQITAEEAGRLLHGNHTFAEPLLRKLGAETVDSMDASAYEGATELHDMNTPIPRRYAGRYSVVLDSGSLEHVFDFPQAIRNCLEMVQDGGHFLAASPANNAMGHGFYQFSPELFYRILSHENGFEVRQMLVTELGGDRPWYAVQDPAKIGRRAKWRSKGETYLMVFAQKIRTVTLFERIPQQSDYAAQWAQRNGSSNLPAHGPNAHWLSLQPSHDPAVARRPQRFVARAARALARRAVRRWPSLNPEDSPSVPDPECFIRIELPRPPAP
jgi:hypothetical protein